MLKVYHYSSVCLQLFFCMRLVLSTPNGSALSASSGVCEKEVRTELAVVSFLK